MSNEIDFTPYGPKTQNDQDILLCYWNKKIPIDDLINNSSLSDYFRFYLFLLKDFKGIKYYKLK